MRFVIVLQSFCETLVKDKYGESAAMKMIVDGEEDSSSTSESEDEDGEVSLLLILIPVEIQINTFLSFRHGM